jgi:WD40 repeat protein
MKIEITYDIIAKKIFEKGSEEDKAFSRATRLVRERSAAFKDTKTYLTNSELDFIEPQETALIATLEKEEVDFIKRSKRQQQKRLVKKLLTAAVIGLIMGIIVFYLVAYYNKKFAVWSGVASKTEELVSQALQMMDKDPTIALNLVNQALEIDSDNESAKQVIYLLYKENIFYKNILTESDTANALAFSPDNRFVAFADRGFVIIKDVNGLQTYKRKLHNGIINDLVFENSSTVLSVGNDNKIMRWKFKGKTTKVEEINHKNRPNNNDDKFPADINAIDVTANGRYIIVGRGEKASDCLLIDTRSDTTYVLDDTDGRIHDVAFSKPNPNAASPLFHRPLIVAGGDNDVILVYDLETRELKAESRALDKNTAKDIYSIAVNSKTSSIVAARDHDVIRVFNILINDNKKLSNLDYTVQVVDELKEHSDKVRCVRFSKDGGLMLSASVDKTIILWNTDTWESLYRLKGHISRVYKAEFSNDGRYIASAGYGGKVIIWNLKLKNPTILKEKHARRVSALGYSLNGKRAFSGTWGNSLTPKRTFISWNTLIWQPIQIDSFDNDIEAVAPYYQDSVLVAVGKILFLVDNKNNTITEIDQADATIKTVAIAPNNKYIAFAGRDDKVYIRETKKGKEIHKKILTVRLDNVNTPQDGDVYCLAISPNSQYLAAGRRNRTIVIWDVSTNKQLSEPISAHDSLYQVDNEVYSITFVDDTHFLSTGRDNTVRRWEIDKSEGIIKRINDHQGHAGGIRCLAVHPSKKMYITGGGDGQLKLWGMNGNLIQVIDAYSNDTEPCTGDEVKCREDFGVVTAVSFSKDGNQILFGNGNGKIKTIYTIEGAMAKHEIYKTKVTSLNMQ